MVVIHVPGEQRIVTRSLDGSLRVWDLRTGELMYWYDGESSARSIALSPDGKKIVSGSVDGAVRLWNIDTGNIMAKWTGQPTNVTYMCWSRGADRVLGGCYDGTAMVWDVESGKTVLEIKTGLGKMWEAIYSPDMTMIATGGDSEDKEFIKIWDTNTCKLVTNLKEHTSQVTCLAWTLDGKTLISGSNDHSIRTWDTATWRQLTILAGHTSDVVSIAISPNDRILASASFDRTAQLWNLENGQPIGEPLQHARDVHCVSFSTDGMLLATGCHDTNAYSWDISVIIGDTGLNEFLPNDTGKLLDADARDAKDAKQTFLDVDATNPFAQSTVNDDGRHDPYDNFFASSQSSLPFPRRCLLHAFSLLRPLTNQSIELQKRLAHFFTRRASSISPLPTPANNINEQTNPTPEATFAAGNEVRDNSPDCSTDIMSGNAEPDNGGEQREESIPHIQIHSPDDLSSHVMFDSNENRAFWKLVMRARGKDSKKATANITQDSSPDVTEVYAARGFQRNIVYKRKQKRKSPARMSSAHTTAVHTSGSSQPGPSSRGDAAHSSQGQPGLSSQLAAVYTSDDSDSDSSIQGSWNKFFVKLCFPCGRYYEDA